MRGRRLRGLVLHHRRHPSAHPRRLVTRTPNWGDPPARGVCRWCHEHTAAILLTWHDYCLAVYPCCIRTEAIRHPGHDVRGLWQSRRGARPQARHQRRPGDGARGAQKGVRTGDPASSFSERPACNRLMIDWKAVSAQPARPPVSGAMTAIIPCRHASRAYPRAAHRACAPLPRHCRVPCDGWTAPRRLLDVEVARHRSVPTSARSSSCRCAVRTVPEPHVQLAAQLLQLSIVPGAHGVGTAKERPAGDELRLDCGDTLDQREKAVVDCHVCTPELATLPEPKCATWAVRGNSKL